MTWDAKLAIRAEEKKKLAIESLEEKQRKRLMIDTFREIAFFNISQEKEEKMVSRLSE